MTSRFRSAKLLGLFLIAAIGCDQAQFAGPIPYRDAERMAKDLGEKPKLQGVIRKTLADLYGPDVRHINVPPDSGLRDGGIYLANRVRSGDKLVPVLEHDPANGKATPIEGGYALYRKHCLHCHGVFGAGDGPTSAFLYPRPRDYRPGIFKFTSTNPSNAKPTRDDLRKTLLYGLHGTSMPGFEAILKPSEIEQLIDYTTFLAMRGETERYLIDEATNAEDKDAEAALEPEIVQGIVTKVTSSWKEAEGQVLNPSVRRIDQTRASIFRGRDLYAGVSTTGPKLECTGCHGAGGKGDGPAFIDKAIFDDTVFRQWSLDEAIARAFRKERDRAGHHAGDPPKADVDGVAKFLGENPNLLALIRKDHGLMADLPGSAFDEKVKGDIKAVAEAARKLLPELDEPEFRSYLVAKIDLWNKGSLDAWDNPLRPANLVEGTYKGGWRPIDLYWRIAKGINGAKMPAHAPSLLNDEQIWDVVNFVLALPREPELLPVPATAGPARVAASR